MSAFSSIAVAICAPVLGAIADHAGYRKLWIVFFTGFCILATTLLWFVAPSTHYVPLALILVGIGIISSELAFVFYNAMLLDLVDSGHIGR